MAVQTAIMVRAVGSSALRHSPVASVAVMQAGCSGVSVCSMSFTRALKPGLVLAASRLSGWSPSPLRETSKAVASRSFSHAYKPMAGQWRQEDSESSGRGFEKHEVEIDSNEFPRPCTVSWTKELANSVHLIGNVGRDMEIKYLDTGKVVAKSSLAVQRPTKTDQPSWFEMEFWDSLAEIAGHHLKKGDWVYVTGRMVVETYMKNEVNQRTAKVVVQNVQFVEDSRGPAAANAQASGRGMSSSWNQPRSTQNSAPGAKTYASGNPDMEKLWNEYFSDPTQWWDNRAKKASPKSPDFKHKTTQEALWIVSRKTPSWVPTQLEKLEAARQEHIANGGGRRPQNSRSFSGADFKDF